MFLSSQIEGEDLRTTSNIYALVFLCVVWPHGRNLQCVLWCLNILLKESVDSKLSLNMDLVHEEEKFNGR